MKSQKAQSLARAIVSRWDKWDEEAGQHAQLMQDSDVWQRDMQNSVLGLILDYAATEGMSRNDIRRYLKHKVAAFQPLHGSDWNRAGNCICYGCGHEYMLHPLDDNDPYLHVLCDGQRVKL